MPNRAGHVMATWNGSLVVHGGYHGVMDFLNDVWLLNLETFVWTELYAGKYTLFNI